MPPPSPARQPAGPWFRSITAGQWKSLLAAQAGWTLDALDFVIYLMAIPALQKEFGFELDTAGLLVSVSLLSSSVGGILFGALADRLGRKRAVMGAILVYSFCSLGTATAGSLWQLICWRVLLGLGMGGEWTAGAVLVSESWPAAHRGKAIGIVQSGWALGYILAALVSAVILPPFGWRWLFAAGVLPALLVLWIQREVAEPALWSRTRQQPWPRLAARMLKPDVLRNLLLAIALSGTVMLAYWGLFTWIPNYLATAVEKGGVGLGLVKSTVWIVPMQLGALAGYLSFGFLSDRFGRRPIFAAFLLGAAAVTPCYGMLAHSTAVLMVLGPLLGFLGHGYFSVFGALLAELFPTELRATAQGLSFNLGRAIGALAPLTIGMLAKTRGVGPALALTAMLFLAGALVALLLPETRGKSLEDLA
jgi:MFS family permease